MAASKTISIFINLVTFFILITSRSTESSPTIHEDDVSSILHDAHNFNIFESLLHASAVDEEIEKGQASAGITLFVSTDESFAAVSDRFKSLPAEQKSNVLRFHVLQSYYSQSSLHLLVNPNQPTLATEHVGAGKFSMNIKNVNGVVTIDTGTVHATVNRVVYDKNPLAIYCASNFLLPKDLF